MIWREKNNERIYAIRGIYKSESTAAGSVVDHLKERLIEEWRHFDHGIIDRGQSVAEATAKMYQ